MRYLSIFICTTLFIFSCGNDGKKSTQEKKTATPVQVVPKKEVKRKVIKREKLATPPRLQYFKKPQILSRFQRRFNIDGVKITIESKNFEIAEVIFKTEGLENDIEKSFEISGGVYEVFMLDLDGNGIQEFYFCYLANDDSGIIDVMGITIVNNDLKEIEVDLIEEARKRDTDRIDAINGYLMHGFQSKEGETLFSYYLESDTNGLVLHFETFEEAMK